MRQTIHLFLLAASLCIPAVAQSANRVTILYDAFTSHLELTSDWGYAALVEFEGKRILFDTGNNAAIFEANVNKLHIDLTRLDAVVLSHRHGDHTSGLKYVLSVNPTVPVFAPTDESFRDFTPPAFLTQNADASLPARMRYFSGQKPSKPPSHGTAWPELHIRTVDHMQDLSPRIHLISTMSETPGFRDMPEVSLVLDTERGPIMIVGCSHPGIENIAANLAALTHVKGIYEIIGGMHLVTVTPSQIDHTVSELLDRYHVQRMAPGHCTGERAFALLQQRLGKEYIYAGTGEVLAL